jgi:hypothetical protein
VSIGSTGLVARSAAVGDRAAGHRVEPRGDRAALGLVASGRAPDGRECLLDCVLGTSSVAEPPQREAEDRARVALVEIAERVAVALGDTREQLLVCLCVRRHPRHRRDFGGPGQGERNCVAETHRQCYAICAEAV